MKFITNKFHILSNFIPQLYKVEYTYTTTRGNVRNDYLYIIVDNPHITNPFGRRNKNDVVVQSYFKMYIKSINKNKYKKRIDPQIYSSRLLSEVDFAIENSKLKLDLPKYIESNKVFIPFKMDYCKFICKLTMPNNSNKDKMFISILSTNRMKTADLEWNLLNSMSYRNYSSSKLKTEIKQGDIIKTPKRSTFTISNAQILDIVDKGSINIEA